MWSSTVTPGDFACFIPALKNFTTPLYISTTFNGTADYMNISAAGIRTADNGIMFEGSGKLKRSGHGIEWSADIDRLTCTEKGINSIIDKLPGENGKLKETATRLGDIQYKGDIGGTGNSLHAEGTLTSGIGSASFKLKQAGTHINAHLETNRLDIGRLTGNNKFGTLATTVDVSCKRTARHCQTYVWTANFHALTITDIHTQTSSQKAFTTRCRSKVRWEWTTPTDK